MNLFAAFDRSPIAWWKAIGLSLAAFYIPFIVMAVYTGLYVDCSHCKTAVWAMMPVAPGLVPGSMLSLHVFGWTSEPARWITTFIIELLMFAGLTAIVRNGGRWVLAVLVGIMALNSFFAMMTLALIRT